MKHTLPMCGICRPYARLGSTKPNIVGLYPRVDATAFPSSNRDEVSQIERDESCLRLTNSQSSARTASLRGFKGCIASYKTQSAVALDIIVGILFSVTHTALLPRFTMVLFPFAAVLLGCAPLTSALADGLTLALSVDNATQGIAISPDGRKFLSQRYSTTLPPRAVELLPDNVTTVLYPNEAWNSYNDSADPRTTFVNIDGARLGPGRYWLVDGGSTGVDGSSKLVGVNLTTDIVDKKYYMSDIFPNATMNIDDVRFNAAGDVAYLSDTNGALVVLNLTSSTGVHVLKDDPSGAAGFPLSYNHTFVPGYGGGTLSVGLDQIEVSPDGMYLYYQACQGGLYRLETRYIDAALTNATMAESLGDLTEPFAFTPNTGGTAIDGDGNIYASDVNQLLIWKITPEGETSVLVQDDALLWTDLMWVDSNKNLWLPASQMRPGGDGLMADGPNNIYVYPISAGPSPVDHS